MRWNNPLTTGKQFSCEVFFFSPVMTHPSIFWTQLRSNAYQFVQNVVLFLSGKKEIYRLSSHMLIFVVNFRPAQIFWNSTHCLLSPFTLDWSRNVLHNPMWNMAVNNISYPMYPLSTGTEKGYITKSIPFFICYILANKRSKIEVPRDVRNSKGP